MRKGLKMDWHRLTTWSEVCKRATGRRHINAVRTFRAELRRSQVLQLLQDWGWQHGVQARIARHLGVSQATLSRDLAHILPLYVACRHCGGLRPRSWVAEDR